MFVQTYTDTMDHRSLGLLIAAIGGLAILIGLIVMSGGFTWFGRLPGDIRVEREGMRLYLPIVSMLLISIVLTVIVNLVRRWL